MSQACQQLDALIPQGADDYVKAQMAYTYLIDTASYQESEDDQSIAGVFWKKQAVCAGYAERPSIFWIIWVFTVFMWMVIQRTVIRDMPGYYQAGGRVLLSGGNQW